MGALCDLAEQYIEDVQSGKILVGVKIKQAVARHLDDLKQAKKKGWEFDKDEAEFALKCLSILRHTKGDVARQRWNLLPFQAFFIYCIFGWKIKATGLRRFRKVYLSIARKNGKSELAAAIMVILFLFDFEAGAEVYTAATTRDQARKVFDPAAAMLKMLKRDDPDLRKLLNVFTSKNNCLATYEDDGIESKLLPLSKDYDTFEGTNPSASSVDEYHLHKDNGMLKMLELGTGTRSQPLMVITTTRGFDLSGPCYLYEGLIGRILSREIEVDHVFALIFEIDNGDDWKDPETWVKANPGLPYGVPQLEFLKMIHTEAAASGYSDLVHFRVKNLNQWVTAAAGWIPAEDWDKCKADFTFAEMKNRKVFIGMDFASVRDLNSVCYLFPPEEDGEKFRIKWRVYCPGDMIDDPKRNHGKVIYKDWEKMGHITRTDGNSVDFKYILDDTLSILSELEFELAGYDRKFSYGIIPDLEAEDIECEPVPQTYDGLTVPIKQTEMVVLRDMVEVEENPVIDWMMNSVILIHGTNEGVRIRKEREKDKVDGIAAMLNAWNVFLKAYADPRRGPSMWDDIAQKGLILMASHHE